MNKQSGMTLIELMIVLGIIGILLTLAFPSYRNYVVKTRVSEVINSMSSCQALAIDFYLDNSGWIRADGTGITDQNLCDPNGSQFEIPGSMEVDNNGVIVADLQNLGYGLADGLTISTAPIFNNRQITGWTCGNAANGTTLEKQYLPSTCQD